MSWSRGRAVGIERGELLSASSALLLLVITFTFRWYGVVGAPRGPDRSGMSYAEDAWHALTVLRWLMLLTILIALGSLVLHWVRRLQLRTTRAAPLVAGTASLTAALLFYRLLIDPPSSGAIVDIKLGGFLGLLSAVGIALGGYDSLRAHRPDRGE